MKKKNERQTKGITLIALVITIIVLLILAGVSIAMLIGPNGLITKAQEAKTKTEKAGIDEQRKLAMTNAILHQDLWYYKEGGGELTEEEFKKLGIEEDDPEREKYVPIPGGFAPTEIEGEDTIDEGLVILDSEGNEFVWIPCTEEDYTGAKNAVIAESWDHDDSYTTNGEADSLGWHDNYLEEEIEQVIEAYGTEAQDTISEITSKWENNQTTVATESIKKYKGFYIARYEAGIPTNAPFYTSPNDDHLTYKNNGKDYKATLDANDLGRGLPNEKGLNMIKDLKPVSKKGVQVWNFITPTNSKIVAENMYKTNSTVGSYLVDSTAWNHICKNILNKNTSKSITENAYNWGNFLHTPFEKFSDVNGLWVLHGFANSAEVWANQYKMGKVTEKPNGPFTGSTGTGTNRIELSTGASENFKNYNIYDMAGNVWDYTSTHSVNNSTLYFVHYGR